MDPIAILQSRIEQLEAKLGLNPSSPKDGQHGDSATMNLINAAQAITNATAGHEKLHDALQIATELNNYNDPNFVENMQQNDMHEHEVVAAEPLIHHHCQCMQRCKQIAPVLESEAIQKAAQMQSTVNNMHAEAQKVKAEADEVSHGIQQLAETCGSAAAESSEQLANVAQNVEQIEEKMFPRRRNGLD